MTELRALVVDYGGVLTTPVADSMSSWCEADGVDADEFRRVARDWFGDPTSTEAALNPIHALERGELQVADFERELAARLRARDGAAVPATGLLARMFAGFAPQSELFDALRRVRAAGRSTALLSNSWGLSYPREGWDELFDVVVISGEVGLRKPEAEIYRLTAAQLGLEPAQCVFVDDLGPNVRAAVDVGMVGVHHVTPEQTLDELEALFNLPLR